MRKRLIEFRRIFRSAAIIALFAMGYGLANAGMAHAAPPAPQVQWVNHLDLVPGDPTVVTATPLTHPSNSISFQGLLITSSTLGDLDSNNTNKVVFMGLELPKQVKITGVRVCYELSDPGANGSFIEQIRLAQTNNVDGSNATVLLDDATVQDASGPTCVNSTLAKPPIKASAGPIVLSFRINTGNVLDQIVIHSVGLLVK